MPQIDLTHATYDCPPGTPDYEYIPVSDEHGVLVIAYDGWYLTDLHDAPAREWWGVRHSDSDEIISMWDDVNEAIKAARDEASADGCSLEHPLRRGYQTMAGC